MSSKFPTRVLMWIFPSSYPPPALSSLPFLTLHSFEDLIHRAVLTSKKIPYLQFFRLSPHRVPQFKSPPGHCHLHLNYLKPKLTLLPKPVSSSECRPQNVTIVFLILGFETYFNFVFNPQFWTLITSNH